MVFCIITFLFFLFVYFPLSYYLALATIFLGTIIKMVFLEMCREGCLPVIRKLFRRFSLVHSVTSRGICGAGKMLGLYFGFGTFVIFAVVVNAYKVPHENSPVGAIKPPPLEYKGPVFLIKETDDANEPFIGLIVEGGIEMVRPYPKPAPVPYANLPNPVNQSIRPEIQEDPEYFAVLVTPETIAQAQISRSTTINVPLTLLLTGYHMPWLMVLKKNTHFEYFKTPPIPPRQMMMPVMRRRHQREVGLGRGSLYEGARKYDLLYSEEDKIQVHGICTSIVKELVTLNNMLQSAKNNVSDGHDADLSKGIVEEYPVW